MTLPTNLYFNRSTFLHETQLKNIQLNKSERSCTITDVPLASGLAGRGGGLFELLLDSPPCPGDLHIHTQPGLVDSQQVLVR